MSAYMESSSSEDEAENERLKSALWTQTQSKPGDKRLQQAPQVQPRQCYVSMKPSIRQQINEESLDQFNEDHKNVTATPEFRIFVAKKLSEMLDSSLESVTIPRTCKARTDHHTALDTHGVFMLLSTSCQGSQNEPTLNPPVRKRPPLRRRKRKLSSEDSSDSDVESRRLAEAAVSGLYILGSSAISTPSTVTSALRDSDSDLDRENTGGDISDRASTDNDLKSKVECNDSLANQRVREHGSDIESPPKQKKKKARKKLIGEESKDGLSGTVSKPDVNSLKDHDSYSKHAGAETDKHSECAQRKEKKRKKMKVKKDTDTEPNSYERNLSGEDNCATESIEKVKSEKCSDSSLKINRSNGSSPSPQLCTESEKKNIKVQKMKKKRKKKTFGQE